MFFAYIYIVPLSLKKKKHLQKLKPHGLVLKYLEQRACFDVPSNKHEPPGLGWRCRVVKYAYIQTRKQMGVKVV